MGITEKETIKEQETEKNQYVNYGKGDNKRTRE